MMVPGTTDSSSDEFVRAFESILESLAECSSSLGGKREKVHLSEDQLNTVRGLHDLVSTGDLKSEPLAGDTIKLCDGFINEWEATGVKSAAVQQLVALLNRPHVRGVLVAAEDIASCRYSPELPAIPFEVDEDEGIAVKIVRIMKKEEPLGATIKCENGRVTIARIIAGGVADRSACIQEGDRVLEVNGHPVSPEMCAEDIVRLLNRSDNGSVTFKLVPAAAVSSSSFTSRDGTLPRKAEQTNLHIRAQFSYDGRSDARQPCRDTALSFSKGDILELLVCTDQHWWQARCIGNGALAHGDDSEGRVAGSSGSRVGLIPSESLQLRSRQSQGGGSGDERGRGSVMSRHCAEEDPVYESVCRLYPRADLVRPIVLLGPPGVGRNELKRRLLMLFPERFSTTIPHTSRPPRTGESDGCDYYFVARETMENMITRGEMLEFGEYRGNLYGTALCAVHSARESGIPLLTPHPLALCQLRTAEFRPFVIFIQPPDAATFKATRSAFRARASRAASMTSAATSTATRGFTDAEIEQIVEAGEQLDGQYGHLFDARIVNCNLEDSLARLISLIQAMETKPSWVPLSWATRQ